MPDTNLSKEYLKLKELSISNRSYKNYHKDLAWAMIKETSIYTNHELSLNLHKIEFQDGHINWVGVNAHLEEVRLLKSAFVTNPVFARFYAEYIDGVNVYPHYLSKKTRRDEKEMVIVRAGFEAYRSSIERIRFLKEEAIHVCNYKNPIKFTVCSNYTDVVDLEAADDEPIAAHADLRALIRPGIALASFQTPVRPSGLNTRMMTTRKPLMARSISLG